jgi:hypothetical protein
MIQYFDFSEVTKIDLIDKDGDVLTFNKYADNSKAVAAFLKCSRTKADEVLEDLRKQYDVFTCSDFQIVLAKGDKIIYNFEAGGETWYNGHKYNELNEWAFRKLVDGIKPKEKKPPKLQNVVVTCTERQVQKAKQLYYAKSIGFDITYKDYAKWHLI